MDLSKASLASAAWAFPLVGAIIGAFGAVCYMSAIWLGTSHIIAAWLAVFSQILLTGGLHEDGLADTADALASGRGLEKRLEIMRDSRIGSYGAIALIVALSLRANAISELTTIFAGFLIAGACSRAAIVVLIRALPPARKDGLAKTAGRPSLERTLAAVLFAILFIIIFCDLFAAIKFSIALTATCFIAYTLTKKNFSGITGDTLGAFQQLIEIGIFIALTMEI